MEEFAQQFGDEMSRRRYDHMATVAHWSFNRLFWNEREGCLYDVVNGGLPDGSIRPNQIFAVSLPHSMLSEERARKVVQVVERELLTPYGLRSLSPSDPHYRGRYEGGVYERDSAYHQGTAWPWLMGPFISSYVKVNGRSREAREQAGKLLVPLTSYLNDAGVGQIPEVFDGDPPYRPGGCIAQAWSVAEILRAISDDVLQLKKTSHPVTKMDVVVAG
jgi:glycogen debranching enzyme